MEKATLNDFIFAAGHFLSDMPAISFWEEWHEGKEGTHGTLLPFIEENPWRPFEDYSAEQIWTMIRDLANSIAQYVPIRGK